MLAPAQTNDQLVLALCANDTLRSDRQRNEVALVRRVQSGDQTAFRTIVDHYQAKVFSVIHRILRRQEDTEDIAQVVFTKVYFAMQSFDFRCSLMSWICKIAINECYSYLRRRRVRKDMEPVSPGAEDRDSEVLFGASHEPGADTEVAARDYLNKLLSRISDDDRWLLIMKEVEGMSVAQLSSATGASQCAIKTRLFRARQRMIKVAEQLSQRPVAIHAA